MLGKRIRPAYLVILLATAFLLPGYRLAARTPLDEQLERAGRAVEIFWQQIGSFACTELLTQEKINKKEKAEYKADSTYDYLALTRTEDERLTIEELRMPKKSKPGKGKKPSLLTTNGFPTLLLIFHPQYQSDYRYQMNEPGGGRDKVVQVNFEQIAGAPSTCALSLKERVYPLSLRGTAWIERDTGIIERIKAGLTAPLKDINIQAFDIDVVYKPQTFASDSEMKWLPSIATIDVRTALQHWRNVHLFSQYKRFTVLSLESELR